jgi:endonuclease/exonuclease/phosphatase family metal-dependent hydrolase
MLGGSLVFRPTIVRGERRYGNAILTRLPIRSVDHRELSRSVYEPRNAIVVEVEVAGRRFAVVGAHLSPVPFERGRHAADLSRIALTLPSIVCGDFNRLSKKSESALEKRGLRDVARELGADASTFPSPLPFLRLDRIHASRELHAVEVRVHTSELAKRASDHLPVVARFELSESRALAGASTPPTRPPSPLPKGREPGRS